MPFYNFSVEAFEEIAGYRPKDPPVNPLALAQAWRNDIYMYYIMLYCIILHYLILVFTILYMFFVYFLLLFV